MPETRLKKMCFLFKSGPDSTFAVREGLDAALVCATLGHPTELLFKEDSVLALLNEREAKDFRELAPYGIGTLYVNLHSLASRGLKPAHLIAPTTCLDEHAFNKILHCGQVILSF